MIGTGFILLGIAFFYFGAWVEQYDWWHGCRWWGFPTAVLLGAIGIVLGIAGLVLLIGISNESA